MGMKIHFKIRKIEEILPNFWKLFKKLKVFVNLGTIIFHISFKNMTESSVKNVGRQNSQKDVDRRKTQKYFFKIIQTLTYCTRR